MIRFRETGFAYRDGAPVLTGLAAGAPVPRALWAHYLGPWPASWDTSCCFSGSAPCS